MATATFKKRKASVQQLNDLPVSNKSIVLFDGVCNLCNASVLRIIRHDPKQHFLFASLQSAEGKDILAQYRLSTSVLPESIVLIENGKTYQYSSAILRIAHKLNGFYPLLFVLMIIPNFLRDAVYKYIACHRYQWYGKRNECMIPTPKLKMRFLSSDVKE